MYRCKCDEKWVKKIPFVQAALGDPYFFSVQFVLRKFSCCHRAFGDIARHRSPASHKKFKKKLNNHKRPDDILKNRVVFKSKLPYFL